MLVSYHPAVVEMGDPEAPRPVPGTEGQPASAYADTLVLPWNDLPALENLLARQGAEIAAVIMEPVLCNSGVIAPRPGYLEAVRALTNRYGIVLIFDEVITGFRLAAGGAQEVYGVTPDLAIYAKAIAAGFPLSAVAGRREIMDMIASGRVKHSGSDNGNPISLAAADAALAELSRPGVFAHLNAQGAHLADGARTLLARHGIPALVHQAGPVLQILFTDQDSVTDYRAFAACNSAMSSALTRELCLRGVLLVPDGRWYLSTVHTAGDIDEALAALDGSLAALSAR
jgi:glutamate-1-semialdehyde 2,1-aminomutase